MEELINDLVPIKKAQKTLQKYQSDIDILNDAIRFSNDQIRRLECDQDIINDISLDFVVCIDKSKTFASLRFDDFSHLTELCSDKLLKLRKYESDLKAATNPGNPAHGYGFMRVKMSGVGTTNIHLAG